ncbi:hypothetical protein [Streptomyces sp. CdTB01]|uniref:hypothetical protein n=1 Tax=unclassified Streptomyces TaxID=2593676 RepID=UPI001EEFC670|nr:hypothetical protein [Streptomyces sp. CdTB01]
MAVAAIVAVAVVVLMATSRHDGSPGRKSPGGTGAGGSPSASRGFPTKLPSELPSKLPSRLPSEIPSGIESLIPSLGSVRLP